MNGLMRSYYIFRLLVFLTLFLTILVFSVFYPSVQETEEDEEESGGSYLREAIWHVNSMERKCFIDEWNQISTSTLPNSFSRWMWMRQNLPSENNLNYTALSLFSAFVYPEFISVTITSQHLLKTKLFCRYLDCNRNEIIGTESGAVVFPESIVYCPRRRGAQYISLTRRTIDVPFDIMPLTFRAYVEPVHEFSICVAPLYGEEPKWLKIIEFVEHHKLQGATFFYVYIGTISEYDRIILDEYVRTGEIELIQMRDKFERPFFSWNSIQVQDCHHRSKYHSKWTAFLDTDERIETFRSTPVIDLLRRVEDENIGEVQMAVRTILKTEDVAPRYETIQRLYSGMIFRKFKNSTEPSWDETRAIIRSDKIGIMDAHGSIAMNPGIKSLKMPKTKMLVRHYRNTNSDSQDHNPNWFAKLNSSEFTISRLDPTFARKLTNSVVEKVQKVYEIVRLDCKWINESVWKSKQLADPCLEKPDTFQNID